MQKRTFFPIKPKTPEGRSEHVFGVTPVFDKTIPPLMNSYRGKMFVTHDLQSSPAALCHYDNTAAAFCQVCIVLYKSCKKKPFPGEMVHHKTPPRIVPGRTGIRYPDFTVKNSAVLLQRFLARKTTGNQAGRIGWAIDDRHGCTSHDDQACCARLNFRRLQSARGGRRRMQ